MHHIRYPSRLMTLRWPWSRRQGDQTTMVLDMPLRGPTATQTAMTDSTELEARLNTGCTFVGPVRSVFSTSVFAQWSRPPP